MQNKARSNLSLSLDVLNTWLIVIPNVMSPAESFQVSLIQSVQYINLLYKLCWMIQ